MAIRTGRCVACGEPFVVEARWGTGKVPKTCPMHRGRSWEHVPCKVAGCGNKVLRQLGQTIVNCVEHRGWRTDRPPVPEAHGPFQVPCHTCGVLFEAPKRLHLYCCSEHNPGHLTSDERKELVLALGRVPDWPKAYMRPGFVAWCRTNLAKSA